MCVNIYLLYIVMIYISIRLDHCIENYLLTVCMHEYDEFIYQVIMYSNPITDMCMCVYVCIIYALIHPYNI